MLLLTLVCALAITPNNQFTNTISAKADNYNIIFSKTKGHKIGDYVTSITCSFDVFFNGNDSIVLAFGGNMKDLSVRNLSVHPKAIRYSLNYDDRTLTIFKQYVDTSRISLSYDYCNMMSAIIAGGNKESELWDITYSNSAEYFYPFIPGDAIYYSVSFLCRKGISYVSSCQSSGRVRIPISFVWFANTRYQYLESEYCRLFQYKGQQASSIKVTQLSNICKQSLAFFEHLFGDVYANQDFGTERKPLFFFHTANDAWNRYNNGFISASQSKFSTYDNILPLVHELGHRWIGEFSFPMKEKPGYSFLIESINEFLVWLFVRSEYGTNEYCKLLEKSQALLENEIQSRSDSISLFSLTKNTDYTLAYIYGPMLLNKYSLLYGFDKIEGIISDVYHKNKFNQEVCIEDFCNIMMEYIGETATEQFIDEMSKPIFYRDITSSGH